MPYKDPEKARLSAIERNKRWKKRHPEQVREMKRRQYRRNGAEQKRKWREKNPEKSREAFRRWVRNNPDRVKERQIRYAKQSLERRLAWRKLHPDRDKAAQARWRAKNKEKLRQQRKDRTEEFKSRPHEWAKYRLRMTHNLTTHRARQRTSEGSHTLQQWLARVEFYGWRCVYCSKPLVVGTLTKDHRLPVSKGGIEWASNLVPACQPCNSEKGNRKVPRILPVPVSPVP